MEQMKLSGTVCRSGKLVFPTVERQAVCDSRNGSFVTGCGASGRFAYPDQIPILQEAFPFDSVFPETFLINEVRAE